ncbi:MAG: ADP-ribosylglycohydrolase family protein [Steroidobacteraceae bacterium]
MKAGPHVPASATPLENTYWVKPGRWLAGEYPAGRTAAETIGRLDQLIGAGIDFFLDLTAANELPPYAQLLPSHAMHVRKAIPDHSVPGDAAQMFDILATIDTAIGNSRNIYLHCRAGIGRTGITVGCYLGGRGMGGTQALLDLNELWQQCARSRAFPYVPETTAQEAFVREWGDLQVARAPARHAMDPGSIPVKRAPPGTVAPRWDAAALGTLQADDRDTALHADRREESGDDTAGLDLESLSVARRLRERFHGALIGLAVGDALAAATQFRKPGSFAPIGDLLGGGPFDLPRGAWTDDTAMALCLAESLLECRGFDGRDQSGRYVRWQLQGHLSATGQCVGISASVAKALGAAKWRRQLYAGSHDPEQVDKEVLSRVAPVVMFNLARRDDAIREAAESARPTCQAPLALEVCRLFAAMLHAALTGRPKAEILEPAPGSWSTRALTSRMESVALAGYAGKDASSMTSAGDALDALEGALWAFATTSSYRAGALAAANLGGDADVRTAVYGQLAGAYYGVSAIPTVWRSSLIRRDLIQDLADRLLAQAMLDLSQL